MEVSGKHHVQYALRPGKRPVAHCTGGWVGLKASLDGCGKLRFHRDSITVQLLASVTIPTALSQPWRLSVKC
jgi:hypothetical protein